MRTIQMTLDDDLVNMVDKIVKDLNTSRSAFTRQALRKAIDLYNIKKLENEHRKGYERFPVTSHEFSVWEDEQNWGGE